MNLTDMRLFFIISVICLTQYSIMTDALQIVSQEIHRSDITVGDKVIYTITIVSDEDVSLNIVPLTAKSDTLEISPPEITTIDESSSNQNEVIKEIVYQVFPFDVGENEIPPVYIACGNQTAKSKPMRFEVRSVLPSDAKKIRDIKSPVDIPKNWLAYSILGVVILIVLSSSLYFIKRYSSSQKSSIPQKSKPLPHEIAHQRLAQIRKMKLIDKGLTKEYYSRISQVVRDYIGAKYEINALESTSYELMQSSVIQNLPKTSREMLRELLRASDLVKFARYIPDKAEAHEFLKYARKFIDETSVN